MIIGPLGGSNIYNEINEMRSPAQIFAAAIFITPYRGQYETPNIELIENLHGHARQKTQSN